MVTKYNIFLQSQHFLVLEGYDPRIHALYYCPQLYKYGGDKTLVPLEGEEIGKLVSQAVQNGVVENQPWFPPSEMLPRAFFVNDTSTTEIYTLSLHDALPICPFHKGQLVGRNKRSALRRCAAQSRRAVHAGYDPARIPNHCARVSPIAKSSERGATGQVVPAKAPVYLRAIAVREHESNGSLSKKSADQLRPGPSGQHRKTGLDHSPGGRNHRRPVS